jgi:hypothetical protein
LIESAFQVVFKRILGDPFASEHGSYKSGLQAAGILPRDWWINLPGMITAYFTFHMDKIDVIDSGTQNEVARLGLAYSSASHIGNAAFLDWLRLPFNETYDNFKPFLALMFLNEDGLTSPGDLDYASKVREACLRWIKENLHNMSVTGSLKDVRLHDGDHDRGFALAVAMLIAHKQGKPSDGLYHDLVNLVNQTLTKMRDQLLVEKSRRQPKHASVAVPLMEFGAGCSPLENEEADARVPPYCYAEKAFKLVSEWQDKIGNWSGYIPTLALAWRHLLEAPDPFPSDSGIVLPGVASWGGADRIAIPPEVITEANQFPTRMLIGVATDQGPVPLLFVSPPTPRTASEDIGRFPEPQGVVVEFECSGGWFPTDVPFVWDYPTKEQIMALAHIDDEQLFGDMDWRPVPQLDELDSFGVKDALPRHPVLQADGNIRITVSFGFPQIRLQRPFVRFGHFKGRVHLMWQR